MLDKTKMSARFFTCTALVGTSLLSAPALAQDAENNLGLEDIIVTAQKREQNLQDVPVAVTALSENFMKANRVQTIIDLNATVPNLNIRTAAAGGSLPAVVLRGLLSYGVAPGADKQVSMYVDGVYLGNAFGAIFEMADVERIEVLRGPQGTLFGRNATAGAISIVTKKPTGELSLHQEFTYGNYDQFRARMIAHLPAFGPIKASLSYSHGEKRGDIRNLGAGTTWDFSAGGIGTMTAAKWLGDENSDSFAGSVLFEPEGIDLSVLYKFDYTDDRKSAPGAGIVVYNFTTANVGPAAPLFQALIASQPDTSNQTATGLTRRPKAVNNDFTFPGRVKTWGHTITANWQISDSLGVKSITAWRENRMRGSQSMVGTGGLVNTIPLLGGDPTNPPPFIIAASLQRQIFGQFSEELQLNYDSDLLTVTAGLYHYKQTSINGPVDGVRFIHAFKTYPNHVVPYVPGEAAADTKGRSQAAYAQAELHLTPQIDIIGGYRITKDKKEFTAFGSTAPEGLDSFTYNYKDTNDSYTIGVNFRPNDDVLTYAKFSHSYMSGGSSYKFIYDPEYADSWEAGIKADLLDKRLRTNLALFSVKYKGMQLYTSGASLGSPDIGIAVINAGNSRARGFELEVTANPVERLTLAGGLGYLDFKYQELTALGAGITNNGYRPQYRPKWTANLSADYETQPIFGDAYLRFRVDGNFRSHQWLTRIDDTVTQTWLSTPGIWILNSRIALSDIDLAGHKAEIALWGRNLTNDDHMAFVNNFGFTTPAMYERARTYGIDLTFDW